MGAEQGSDKWLQVGSSQKTFVAVAVATLNEVRSRSLWRNGPRKSNTLRVQLNSHLPVSDVRKEVSCNFQIQPIGVANRFDLRLFRAK